MNALLGNTHDANQDLDAANRFGHDLDADLVGMIPGVGKVAGAGGAIYDANETYNRATGDAPGSPSGDLVDTVDYIPTIPRILQSLYPANPVDSDSLTPATVDPGTASTNSGQMSLPDGGTTSTDPGLVSLPDGGTTSALVDMLDLN